MKFFFTCKLRELSRDITGFESFEDVETFDILVVIGGCICLSLLLEELLIDSTLSKVERTEVGGGGGGSGILFRDNFVRVSFTSPLRL